MMKHTQGTFRALGNMGDALMKMAQFDDAVPYYHKQLAAAKQSRDRPLEACAYGALGMAHRVLRQFDKALGFHTQVGDNRVWRRPITQSRCRYVGGRAADQR